MSRDEFENWFYFYYEPEDWRHIDIEKSYEAWLAGRESMRNHAAEIAANQWVKDPQVSACDQIMDIEP